MYLTRNKYRFQLKTESYVYYYKVLQALFTILWALPSWNVQNSTRAMIGRKFVKRPITSVVSFCGLVALFTRVDLFHAMNKIIISVQCGFKKKSGPAVCDISTVVSRTYFLPFVTVLLIFWSVSIFLIFTLNLESTAAVLAFIWFFFPFSFF